jgi:hypothetical protein
MGRSQRLGRVLQVIDRIVPVATPGRGGRSVRAGRRWTALAVCAVLGLLAAGAVASPAAASNATSPPGAPGGATAGTATALHNGVSYRGTIATARTQVWYRLRSRGAQVAIVNVWNSTKSCPVQVTLLDARRHQLGRIISSREEILPFVVAFPAHPVSSAYYVLVDTDPYLRCAGAGYVLTLVQPEQPSQCKPAGGATRCGPISSTPPAPAAPETGAGTPAPPAAQPGPAGAPAPPAPQPEPAGAPAPPVTAGPEEASAPQRETSSQPVSGVGHAPGHAAPLPSGCYSAGRALRKATIAVARASALVARRRIGIATLRRLEAARRLARRRTLAACEI